VLHSPDGVPYLAPALQLLFKSKDVRPKDQLDAEEVIPVLDPGALALLDVRLPGDHEWRTLVDSRLKGMSGGDVHAVVSWLSAAGVDVWIDGGWAVDALVAQHTRRHRDLDLALPTRSWAAARAALEDEGFVVVRDDGPFNVVVGDRHGRLVDLHAFDDSTTVSGDDGVAVHGPNGLPYLAEGMTATGTIDGRVVRCISAEHLMRYHSGYELDADDRHDIDLLHRSCGVPLL
jgi:lincosamide nucleotidyltransferase A/C/D/E